MPNQQLLVQSLVELAGNLVDEFDVVDLLALLANRCVDALDVSAAGVMLAAPSGALQVIASSSETMRTLELFQLEADEGPCVDAYRIGRPVLNINLETNRERWPQFCERAVADGFRSAHALPMRLRGNTLGALNLLRDDSGTMAEGDVEAAQALSDIASIAIVQHQLVVDAQTLATQLSAALNSRIVIEQAKGRISQAAGVDMGEAFQRLRVGARDHNLRLGELAADIAEGRRDPAALTRRVPPT